MFVDGQDEPAMVIAEPIQEQLTVHAYNWVIKDEAGDNGETIIHCWALDRNSHPYLLRIEDFPAYCYLQLPTWLPRGKVWSKGRANDFIASLSRKSYFPQPKRISFQWRKRVYCAHEETPFIRLIYNNLAQVQKAKNFFSRPVQTEDMGALQCHIWEHDITPVRKLLSARNIRYCQWFTVEGQLVPEELRISSLPREYIIEWESMNPVANDVSAHWNTHPGIFSFDIECYSDNHRAMPDQFNALHVITMISCMYQRYGDPSSRRTYLIVLGDCLPLREVDSTVEVIRVATELEVIDTFGRLIRETDPEIITGYNIFSFDYPYMEDRLKRQLCNWPVLGRLPGVKATAHIQSWNSDAYGQQTIHNVLMDGRISIDLLPIIKRDYKLNSYKLGDVATHFLKRTKHDVTPVEMFIAYENMQHALTSLTPDDSGYISALAEVTRVVEYCRRDADLVLDLMDKLNLWISLIEMSNIVGVTIVELFTRGQQIRCVSQLYHLASQLGYVVDRRDVAGYKFKGGFVQEPIPGVYDNVICLDFSSMYPSIIRAYNICYTTLIPPELHNQVADDDCHTFVCEESEDSAKMHTFKFRKSPEGLLPMLVRQLVLERKQVRDKMAEIKKQLKECAPEEKHSLSVWMEVLDKRQNALKVSANSFYGFLGVHQGGKMPLIEGAISVCSKGRQLISDVSAYINKRHQGIQVYSDTDSTMVYLPHLRDSAECAYWGKRLAEEISGIKPGGEDCDGKVWPEGRIGLFPPPLVMEFEKAMRLLCICKKRYAAYHLDESGGFKSDDKGVPIMVSKGVVLVRRDNCALHRQIYKELLRMILDGKPLIEAIEAFVHCIYRLLQGEIDYQDLVIVKELSGSYKSDTALMKVFSNRLKSIGKSVAAGDRLDYLILDNGSGSKVGGKAYLYQEYLEMKASGVTYNIDYEYYITKALGKSINKLIAIGFAKELECYTHITYRPTNQHKPIGLKDIANMLYHLHLRKFDIRIVPEAVRCGGFTKEAVQRTRQKYYAPKINLK